LKNKLMILSLVCASFLAGVSFADQPEIVKKKASIMTTQSISSVIITIAPDPGYKWNELYPAALKYSVCSDQECVTYTENISIKKVK